MILRVSPRHALQHRVLLQTTEALRYAARDVMKRRGLLGDRVADSVQLWTRRHPDPGAEHRAAARLEMEVESRAPLVPVAADPSARATMMEPAGGVRLVRRLVLREPRVAIDSEHRSLRVAANLRSEAAKAHEHVLDELTHRVAHFLLVLTAVRLEPLLVVMRRQTSKELER